MKKLNTDQRMKLHKPIEIWENIIIGWRWEVYKKYQKPENEAKNQYARWFCKVTSPLTFGGADYGDVYVSEIKENAVRIYSEDEGGEK